MDAVVLDTILPLFGIMVAGYVAGRFGLLGDDASAALSRFTFVAAMPALVFVSLSRVPVAEFFNWPFLGTLGGGMAVVYLLSVVVARFAFPGSLTALSLHGLTAMFSSTAYIGLPMLLVFFGEAATVPGIIGAVITGVVFFPIAVFLAELDKGDGGSAALVPLIAMLKNPVLIATAAGLAVSGSGISLPAPVASFCELLGGAFIPCALFSAGLYLVGASATGDAKEIGWLVFVKLALHPLITWWLAYHVFRLEGILPAIAVLQAALPAGVPVFVLAQQYGVFTARSNAVIVLSTALSVLTLSGLLILLSD